MVLDVPVPKHTRVCEYLFIINMGHITIELPNGIFELHMPISACTDGQFDYCYLQYGWMDDL